MGRASTFLPRDEASSPKRLTVKDAERIAFELMAVLRNTARPYALFIGAERDFLMTPRYGRRYETWEQRWPRSLCGVYTPDANAKDVISDILEMDQ